MSGKRKGAAIAFIAISLPVFLVVAAVSVDLAYMQLVRTELRASTDAAAKAGAVLLSRAASVSDVRTAAIDAALLHRVGGSPHSISDAEIELGRSVRQSDGSWAFTAGAQPYTSVRVASTLTGASAPSLFFGGVLGIDSFTPSKSATATYSENDVCVVVDRSHSMCFDLSGIAWAYPPGTPTDPDPVAYPPHSTLSRWARLEEAVNLFVQTVQNTTTTTKLSLVSFGSEITLATYEGGLTGRTFESTTLDVTLGQDYSGINTKMAARGSDIMLGGTNLSGGIDLGVSVLTGPDARPYATKTMIVMTDGQWNEGRHPLNAATDAKANGITIHTVTFLEGADQTDMRNVAKNTGGRHYHASNGDELVSIFEELALTLPVVLTE